MNNYDFQYQIVGSGCGSNLTAYQHSDDYERLSETKDNQRNKILDFLLSHNPDERIKYTGLPGKYWSMERKLLNIEPEALFSGFEKNPCLYHKTKMLMPGKHKVISKSKPISDNAKIEIHVNGNGVYVLGDINTLTEKKTHLMFVENSGTFKFGFTSRNMIWYDFTSSLNEKTFRAIHDIKKITRKKAAICITIQYGRDLYFNGKGEEARIDIIKAALPEFECLDYWKYKGFNDVPMLNVCGFRRK